MGIHVLSSFFCCVFNVNVYKRCHISITIWNMNNEKWENNKNRCEHHPFFLIDALVFTRMLFDFDVRIIYSLFRKYSTSCAFKCSCQTKWIGLCSMKELLLVDRFDKSTLFLLGLFFLFSIYFVEDLFALKIFYIFSLKRLKINNFLNYQKFVVPWYLL